MMATPVTVINIAGASGSSSSGSGGAALSPLQSRSRGGGRDVTTSNDDDDAPLLGPGATASAAARDRHASSSSNSHRARVRACLSWLSKSRVFTSLVAICSFTGGVTWIVKGLCICLGMMLMGGVGSFTLHQMMSPQIEALLRQRNELQQEMDQLRSQVENATRVANSRLEMIHLLEQELERQAVAAAALDPSNNLNNSSDVFPNNTAHHSNHLHHFSSSRGMLKANFWPTVAYAWTLGAIVFFLIAYRIYVIASSENQRLQKARASSDMDPSLAFPSSHRRTGAGAFHGSVGGSGSNSSSSNTLSSMSDADRTESGLMAAAATIATSATTTSSGSTGGVGGGDGSTSAPKCYKRNDRLVHV